MAFVTLNDVFDEILGRRILRNEEGTFGFDRRQRLEAVLPEELVRYVTKRSASYLSWFANDSRQGDSVREYAGSLFDRDPAAFLQEMTDKCSAFLGRTGGRALGMDVWRDLLDMLGEKNSLFVRGSEAVKTLQKVAEAAPHRALAVLLTEAATGGLTPGRYREILSCWRLMDLEIVSEDASDPQRAVLAGEILYADGQRKEALRQFKRTAQMLEKEGRLQRSFPEEQIGRFYLRMGKMYLQGDGCEADPLQSMRFFEKSAAKGCAAAEYAMGLQLLQEGFPEKAGEYFMRGADAGDPDCLRMMGNACFAGEALAGGHRDLERAKAYYLRGADPEDLAAGDTGCQYMLAQVLAWEQENGYLHGTVPSGKEADPEYWYEAAARGGSSEAAAALNRRRWHAFTGDSSEEKAGRVEEADQIQQGSPLPEGKRREKYCLLNSYAGRNRIFAESLPEGAYRVLVCTGRQTGWTEKDTQTGITGQGCRPLHAPEASCGNRVEWHDETLPQMFCRIARQCLGGQQAGGEAPVDPGELLQGFPDIVLAALGEEEQANIRDGLQSLRTAFLLHEECGAWMGRTHDPAGKAGCPDGSSSGGDLGSLADDARENERLFYLLSDRVRLYVAAREEVAAPLFDSACSRLGDFYLPLHLCDPAKLVSEDLLERMPLFIPCLRGRNRKRREAGRPAGAADVSCMDMADSAAAVRMDTVVFGDHPGIVQLCKDALAAAQIDGIPFSLTVVGEDADVLEERFLAECPGIAEAPPNVSIHRPRFIRMRPESADFQRLLAVRPAKSREAEEERIAALLQAAAYLVVYTKSEDRNMTLAMYLREWYIRTDPSFTRLPFIAAYCEKSERAEQCRTLTVGSEELGFSWYNNYNIETFGMEASLFSWQGLAESRLERRALASHFSYYVNVEKGRSFFQSFSSEAERHRAEHEYYVRSYNRDSSRVNVLALPYRLFAAGITFPDWHKYAVGISQKSLADRFEEWIEGGGSGAWEHTRLEAGTGGKADVPAAGDPARAHMRLEAMAMQEHGRWNRAMLSRGWTGASVEQMQAYIQRGVNRHQLYLAKLHPFLCGWDQLGELAPKPTGLQRSYGFIMQQIRPGKEPPGIRDIDRENVRKTAALLREE